MIFQRIFWTTIAVVTTGMLVIVVSALAVEPAPADPALAAGPATRDSDIERLGKDGPADKQRRREGDRFEGTGQFEATGDRITFYVEGSDEVFRLLENLALERIARILEDPSGLGDKRKWNVTGVVTEYRGSNFLLIERAILKAR